jgi:hypothetical protein
MTSILINGLPSSYQHFLETLQITRKLKNQTFDSLSNFWYQHDKTFGKKKNLGEDILFTNSREGESSKIKGNFKRKRIIQQSKKSRTQSNSIF